MSSRSRAARATCAKRRKRGEVRGSDGGRDPTAGRDPEAGPARRGFDVAKRRRSSVAHDDYESSRGTQSGAGFAAPTLQIAGERSPRTRRPMRPKPARQTGEEETSERKSKVARCARGIDGRRGAEECAAIALPRRIARCRVPDDAKTRTMRPRDEPRTVDAEGHHHGERSVGKVKGRVERVWKKPELRRDCDRRGHRPSSNLPERLWRERGGGGGARPRVGGTWRMGRAARGARRWRWRVACADADSVLRPRPRSDPDPRTRLLQLFFRSCLARARATGIAANPHPTSPTARPRG